ncbi:MAG: hypothetical protein WCC64_13805 [Aliidongia sp.]
MPSLIIPDTFTLALVMIARGFVRASLYVRNFFQREPEFGETTMVFSIRDLLQQGNAPAHDSIIADRSA